VTALSPAERVEQLRAVTGKAVKRLYDAVAGAPEFTLEDLVPPGETGTVIYEGRNSLPMFSLFQKRFTRIGGKVVGYNHQTMAWVTGPGYFVVEAAKSDGPHPGELLFNYTLEPNVTVPGWPEYKANDRGLSRAVYMNMLDWCRKVGPGVLVGKAYKLDVEQGAYFSLSRQP
jgi:hypothetical protein